MPMMCKTGKLSVIAGLTALLAACTSPGDLGLDASVRPSDKPITVDNQRSGRFARIGAAQHPTILANYGGEYSDVKLERMVAGIVGELVTVSDNPTEVYQVSILDSPVINAFALPGGFLYVSRGLLALANDSAELAAVIAHEMAHVTANHGVQRQQKEAEAQLASRIVTEVLADKDAGRKVLARGQVSLAQFSRNQELEADAIGIAAIGEAGFDPYAAARFQQAMSAFNGADMLAEGRDNSFDFLSTHPSTPQRVTLALGHARKYGPPGIGERKRDQYLAGLDGMLYGDSPEEGYVRDQTYAHVGLGIKFTFPEGFDIENRPEAILGARARDGAAVRFDGAEVPKNQSLTTYIASGWVEGLDAGSVRPATINGLEAATAKAQVGRWAFDVTVLRVDGGVFRILTAMPVGIDGLDSVAGQVRDSFTTLSAADRALYQPLRLRIVRAGAGDSIEILSARMESRRDKQGFFRALNGLSPTDKLVPGQAYKIVTQ